MTKEAIAEQVVSMTSESRVPESVAAKLRARRAHVLSGDPKLVPVSEVNRLWTTRLKNTAVTHTVLEGVEALLQAVHSLPEEGSVYQFNYIGDEVAAALFFEPVAGAFLGYALIDRAATPGRM